MREQTSRAATRAPRRPSSASRPMAESGLGTVARPGFLRRKDILDLDDFAAEEIGLVLQTTDAMKEILSRPIKKVPPLRGKTVVNLFYETSTRTRVSFELAAKNLSADVVNVTASASATAATKESWEALGGGAGSARMSEA